MARCGKCGSLAWFEASDGDVVMRCVCGYCAPVSRQMGKITMVRRAKATMSSLPAQDTDQWRCLDALASYGRATTGGLAMVLGQSRKKTSAQLSLLRAKGLADRFGDGRGIEDGSEWELSREAKKLMGVTA